MNKTVKYGIRLKSKDKVLGFGTSSNEGGDFCGDTTTFLDEHGDGLWLVDTAEHAQWVIGNPTPWYNADYETPNHSYKTKDMEVVEVVQSVKPVEVKLPSVNELYEWKWKDDKMGQAWLKDPKRIPKSYSYYDLISYMRK